MTKRPPHVAAWYGSPAYQQATKGRPGRGDWRKPAAPMSYADWLYRRSKAVLAGQTRWVELWDKKYPQHKSRLIWRS